MLKYAMMTQGTGIENVKGSLTVWDDRDTRQARIIVYSVFVTIAFISVVYAYYWMTAEPLADLQVGIHQKVIAGDAPKPVQYRILTYYIVEGLHRVTRMSLIKLDLVLRIIFTSLSLIYFQRYLRRWFDFSTSVVGTLIAAAVLPITYMDFIHQPHDMPNLFFTILALGLIRDRKEAWMLLLIPVAMLNRESFIIVFWAWFFYNVDRLPFKMLITEFALFALLACIFYFALPIYFGPRENYVDTIQIKNNVDKKIFWVWLLRIIVFIGPMIYASFLRFKTKPLFLKRALGFVAIYMAANFVIGMYQETRLFLPILPVLIPLGLAAIFPAYDPDNPGMKTTEVEA